MPPINLHAHFEFSGNACKNCCSRCCSDTKPLYVNKHLQVERWDRHKGNRESLHRTASRVDILVREKLKSDSVDKELAGELIHSKMLLELEKRPVTKKDLKAIIIAIQEIHERSSGSDDS